MTTLPQRLRSSVKVFLRGETGLTPAARSRVETRFPPIFSWYQTAGQKIHDRGTFVGCPLELFELTARDPLCVALMEGLNPDSSVLEVGCGCLRVGYWFIQFLNAGRYCGIEPNEQMLAAGRDVLLGTMDAEKQPRFDTNDRFDFGAFGTTFDFVIAFSIWTHASKSQISTMLDQFKRTANPGAKFVTSWLSPRPSMADYNGTSWVGRSHESDQPGCVAHCPEWIREAAASRGLGLKIFEGFTTIHQNWVIVSCP
jgi:SAM-dependent methyltransferase